MDFPMNGFFQSGSSRDGGAGAREHPSAQQRRQGTFEHFWVVVKQKGPQSFGADSIDFTTSRYSDIIMISWFHYSMICLQTISCVIVILSWWPQPVGVGTSAVSWRFSVSLWQALWNWWILNQDQVGDGPAKLPPGTIHFNGIFHYKQTILGIPIYGNPHIFDRFTPIFWIGWKVQLLIWQ